MASVKISQLTAAASVSGTQEFEINDSGTSKKVTGSQIKTFVKDALAPSDIVGVTASVAEINKLTGATLTTAELNKLAGLTATTAELNVLAGIVATLTAAELSYVDGVTSAIQTQLNSKAALASPALTGTPTAPTAAVATNTTQLATTAFVLANGGISNVNIQVFTASGTYTPTSGYKWGIAFVTGGGSGTQGIGSTDGSRLGGGAGGTAIGVLNLTTLGAVTATVGAGGVGGNSSGASGGNATAAGNSTLSTLTGGAGGLGGADYLPGTASGGAINITGGDGGASFYASTTQYRGNGGASFWGGGGSGTRDAQCFGAGGGGISSSNPTVGTNGMSGVIMIMEFK